MTIRPYLKNELFEGIVSWEEYLIMFNADVLDKFNTVLISIHDPNREVHPPEKVKGFVDVLQIRFWDVEDSIGNYNIIKPEQGAEIRQFIEEHKNLRFLVHCAAGVSRSAGVGMAIECICNYNGNVYEYHTSHSDIKSHNRYSPNYTVFDIIMNN